jgi:hypothetical protein
MARHALSCATANTTVKRCVARITGYRPFLCVRVELLDEAHFRVITEMPVNSLITSPRLHPGEFPV